MTLKKGRGITCRLAPLPPSLISNEGSQSSCSHPSQHCAQNDADSDATRGRFVSGLFVITYCIVCLRRISVKQVEASQAFHGVRGGAGRCM